MMIACVVGVLAVPLAAHAQGIPDGIQHGASVGSQTAGPVGAVVGGAVGGVIGGVEGLFGLRPTYVAYLSRLRWFIPAIIDSDICINTSG
jgi:hypothetical protein